MLALECGLAKGATNSHAIEIADSLRNEEEPSTETKVSNNRTVWFIICWPFIVVWLGKSIDWHTRKGKWQTTETWNDLKTGCSVFIYVSKLFVHIYIYYIYIFLCTYIFFAQKSQEETCHRVNSPNKNTVLPNLPHTQKKLLISSKDIFQHHIWHTYIYIIFSAYLKIWSLNLLHIHI